VPPVVVDLSHDWYIAMVVLMSVAGQQYPVIVDEQAVYAAHTAYPSQVGVTISIVIILVLIIFTLHLSLALRIDSAGNTAAQALLIGGPSCSYTLP